MRDAWITGRQTMVDRLTKPQQVNDAEPEAAMPPYMESFLAHLRLLVEQQLLTETVEAGVSRYMAASSGTDQ